jgi:hypothetical protein
LDLKIHRTIDRRLAYVPFTGCATNTHIALLLSAFPTQGKPGLKVVKSPSREPNTIAKASRMNLLGCQPFISSCVPQDQLLTLV